MSIGSKEDLLSSQAFQLHGRVRFDGFPSPGTPAFGFSLVKGPSSLTVKILDSPVSLSDLEARRLPAFIQTSYRGRQASGARYCDATAPNAPPLQGEAKKAAEIMADALLNAIAETLRESRFCASHSYRKMAEPVVDSVRSPVGSKEAGVTDNALITYSGVVATQVKRVSGRPMNGHNGRMVYQVRLSTPGGQPLGVAELELAEVNHPGTGQRAGLVTLRLQSELRGSDVAPPRLIMVAYLPADAPRGFDATIDPTLLIPGEALALLVQASGDAVPQVVRDDIARSVYPHIMRCFQTVLGAIASQRNGTPSTNRKPLEPPPETAPASRKPWRELFSSLIKPAREVAVSRGPAP